MAKNREGYSKGYGYVQFGTDRGASNAIGILNGIILNDKKIVVEKFVPRAQRWDSAAFFQFPGTS